MLAMAAKQLHAQTVYERTERNKQHASTDQRNPDNKPRRQRKRTWVVNTKARDHEWHTNKHDLGENSQLECKRPHEGKLGA